MTKYRYSLNFGLPMLCLKSTTLFAMLTVPLSFNASALVLEEVVVTALRREQSIQDVAVAVSVYDSARLRAAAIDDISDLNMANASFMASPFLSDPIGNAPVRIRGIGTGGGNPGFESAVGVYVDDVYRSRAGSVLLSLFDMDTVEILRGPQGTLFGKNTTAGALLLHSTKPELGEYSATLSAERGNYGSHVYQGHINTAIGSTAALRVAARYDERDGWFSNGVTQADAAWAKNEGYRASMVFAPNERLNATLIADYSTMETPGNYGFSVRLFNESNDPLQQAAFGAATNAPGFIPGGLGEFYWNAQGEGHDPYDRTTYNNGNGDYLLEQKGLSATVTYDITPHLNLKSITGWRNMDSASLNGDWDFGPVDVGSGLDQLYDFDSVSQEFVLSGDWDLRGERYLRAVSGLHYFQEDSLYERKARIGAQFSQWSAILASATYQGLAAEGALGPLTPDSVGVDVISGCTVDAMNPFCLQFADFVSGANSQFNFQQLRFDQTEQSYGVFAHADFAFAEQWSLLAGVRFNQVEKDITADNQAAADADSYHDHVRDNIYGFYALSGAGLSSPDWNASQTDEAWTYSLTGQYRASKSLQFYLGYSRGFKSGGFNWNENAIGLNPSLPALIGAQASALAQGILPTDTAFPTRGFEPMVDNRQFAPEFVNAYELGARWKPSQNSRLSANVFQADYDDLQVASFTGLTFIVTNAGTSTTEGVELEAEWTPLENLRLSAAATWLDARYGNDVGFLPAGRKRGQTPDETIVLGAYFSQPVTGHTALFTDLNYTYMGEMFLAEGEEGEVVSTLKQDGFSIINAAIGLKALEHWEVALFCKNCLDEDYYQWAFNQPFFNAVAVDPAPPMTWGARVSMQF